MKNHEIVGNLQWFPVNWCMSSIFFISFVCWCLSLRWHTAVSAFCALWENARDLLLLLVCVRLVPFNTHTALSHFLTLFASLWSCTGVFVQQLAAGEQNVFGVCPVSNTIALIVSGCHFARWRGLFVLPVLRLGWVRGSKGAPWRVVKGAAEDEVRALISLLKLTNSSSSTTAPSLKRGHRRR